VKSNNTVNDLASNRILRLATRLVSLDLAWVTLASPGSGPHQFPCAVENSPAVLLLK